MIHAAIVGVGWWGWMLVKCYAGQERHHTFHRRLHPHARHSTRASALNTALRWRMIFGIQLSPAGVCKMQPNACIPANRRPALRRIKIF